MKTPSTPPAADRLDPTRRAVAGFCTTVLALVWAHALAGIARNLAPEEVAPAGWPITLAAVGVALASILGGRRAVPVGLAAGTVAFAAMAVSIAGGGWIGLPLMALGPLAGVGHLELARRLPRSLDGLHTRRPRLAGAWLATAMLAIVQLARLATWMTDHDSDWFLSTRHAFWADHECLNAYVYGGELAARGEENIYDAAHYPALSPEAQPRSAVVGLAAEDPYQYPPPFLLLPGLALAVTDDYTVMRLFWFALQTTLIGGIALWLAAWVGRRDGAGTILLLPLMLSAFPTLHTLQYGQFHLLALALAVGGMALLDRGRRGSGALMLAFSVTAKLFPGILLIVLAVQRRWRDLGAVIAVMLLLALAALFAFGPTPFVAFLDYQVPRLASGEAFAFGEAWPDIRHLVIADNQGVYGLGIKLQEMGVPGWTASASSWSNRLFGIALLGATLLAGRRLRGASRLERAATWIALLGAGSLVSTGAWGDYVPVAAIWLLGVLAVRLSQRRRWIAAAVPCAVLQYTLLGTTPILGWENMALLLPLSAVSAVALIALFAWPVIAGSRLFARNRVAVPSAVALRVAAEA